MTIKKNNLHKPAPQNDVVEIGQIVPLLVGLTEMSNQIILDGFRMAFLNRQIAAPNGKRYLITSIFYSSVHPSKILARLQEVEPEASELEAQSA